MGDMRKVRGTRPAAAVAILALLLVGGVAFLLDHCTRLSYMESFGIVISCVAFTATAMILGWTREENDNIRDQLKAIKKKVKKL